MAGRWEPGLLWRGVKPGWDPLPVPLLPEPGQKPLPIKVCVAS